MRRERRKKKIFNPQTMLHLEYSLRTEKKTPQHKSTYTIKHMTLQHGGHIQLWQAAIRSSAIAAPVSDLLALVAVQSIFRGSWMGEGSNVCNGGREQESLHCIALSGWWNQTALAKALVRGARKIRLSCYDFWGEQLQNFHSSFSLSILISEITKFHFQSSEFHHDGIHIPVYSLSLIADRSSHSFNQNGQPCETLNSCSRLLNFSITQGKA